MKIAISSIGTATAIGLLKCIKNYNKEIKVIGLDINNLGYTAGSMLVDRFYQIPMYNDKLYYKVLLNILKNEEVDIFIPVHDLEIMKIAENIDLFNKNCKIVIPGIDIVRLFSDKYNSSVAMKSIDIDIPEIVKDSYRGKRIIRDRVSVGSKGIKIIDNNIKVILNDHEFMQKYIEGAEYTVDVLSDLDGNPVIIIPRIRLEIKSGVATKVKLVYEPELIEICKTILYKYKIPGLSNIQFIKGKDGIFYFIELNTRFGGMSISSILGSYNYIADFIQLCMKDKLKNNNLEENLKMVKWDSIVTRYYSEVIYHE